MSIEIQSKTQTRVRTPIDPAQEETSAWGRQKSGFGWKRILTVLVVLGIIIGVSSALMSTVSPKNDTKVLLHTIARGDLVVSVTEEGTLESSNNKEIKCRVKGGSTVLSVVESGTEVKPGDLLIQLDTSTIEDNISAQKIVYENALANKLTTESDLAVAKISITEYLEGTFRSEMSTLEKDLIIAKSSLKSAKNSLDHARRMFRKGYISKLELETQEDAVEHAELDVKVKQTDLEVLEKFTKAKTLQEKESLLDVAKARLASDIAALELEEARLHREQQQLKNCEIRAETGGLVIHPNAAEWKEQPDIEEGAAVREDQVLLIMPDLDRMQVKVGIHESKVDHIKPGMPARVELQNRFVDGEVFSISSITKPAGWWTGNVVKYDTIIKLDTNEGLKPGMSVAVEIFMARHKSVLTIPVAAVVDLGRESLCWVETSEGIVKRKLILGDSNDQFIVVKSGLKEGDNVVLNPIDFVEEAHFEALKPGEGEEPEKRESIGTKSENESSKPSDTSSKKSPADMKSKTKKITTTK